MATMRVEQLCAQKMNHMRQMISAIPWQIFAVFTAFDAESIQRKSDSKQIHFAATLHFVKLGPKWKWPFWISSHLWKSLETRFLTR